MSNSCLNTDISLEIDNQISKKIIKNVDIHAQTCTQHDTSDCEGESIVDVVSEMRVDILRLLTVIKSMETQIQLLETRISNETSSDYSNNNNNSNNDNCNSTSIANLNECEIKMDKFKSDVNEEFERFRNQMIKDYTSFRADIIQSAKIRNQR